MSDKNFSMVWNKTIKLPSEPYLLANKFWLKGIKEGMRLAKLESKEAKK